MAYYDKPSKICNSPACHIEFRFCRARICRNYGVSAIMNLQQLDPCAVIRRNCRLSVIDPKKLDKKLDEEAGKMLLQHNRSSGAPKSNRLVMRRRLELLLARALSSPNCSSTTDGLNDVSVQQLIDQVPSIAKGCVISLSPEPLLQGVIAVPPLCAVYPVPNTRHGQAGH